MYSSLKDDYKDDLTLLSYLNDAKQLLTTHFYQFYANKVQLSKQNLSNDSSTGSASSGRTKFDFTARYSKKERLTYDELDEYLKLHPENFDSCCPFQWWQGQRAQFPNLYRLATDVLSIPGKISISFFFCGLAHWVKCLGSAVAISVSQPASIPLSRDNPISTFPAGSITFIPPLVLNVYDGTYPVSRE